MHIACLSRVIRSEMFVSLEMFRNKPNLISRAKPARPDRMSGCAKCARFGKGLLRLCRNNLIDGICDFVEKGSNRQLFGSQPFG